MCPELVGLQQPKRPSPGRRRALQLESGDIPAAVRETRLPADHPGQQRDLGRDQREIDRHGRLHRRNVGVAVAKRPLDHVGARQDLAGTDEEPGADHGRVRIAQAHDRRLERRRGR